MKGDEGSDEGHGRGENYGRRRWRDMRGRREEDEGRRGVR